MKKRLFLICAAALTAGALLFGGCTGGGESATSSESEKKADADIDLTVLSSTMVYAQVLDMVSNPANYIGKTVKMDGTMSIYDSPVTGMRYFACVIQDATACCAQGIEFELNDSYLYPADYPEAGKYVAVVGTFDTYVEDGNSYCTLRNADLVKGS